MYYLLYFYYFRFSKIFNVLTMKVWIQFFVNTSPNEFTEKEVILAFKE